MFFSSVIMRGEILLRIILLLQNLSILTNISIASHRQNRFCHWSRHQGTGRMEWKRGLRGEGNSILPVPPSRRQPSRSGGSALPNLWEEYERAEQNNKIPKIFPTLLDFRLRRIKKGRAQGFNTKKWRGKVLGVLYPDVHRGRRWGVRKIFKSQSQDSHRKTFELCLESTEEQYRSHCCLKLYPAVGGMN